MTPEHRDAIRGLSGSLTALDVRPGLSADSIRELFGAGHGFRLKSLTRSLLVRPLSAELGALIASLPLESLVVQPPTSLHFLSRLASTLRSLELRLRDIALEPHALVAALFSLTGLTSLSLLDSVLTSDDLGAVLRSVPQLQELLLCQMNELQSLAFLSEADAPTLQSLKLHCCYHLSPWELHHLRCSQPQLTALTLNHTFDAPLDDFSLSLLQPPSLFFPRLLTLYYAEPTL